MSEASVQSVGVEASRLARIRALLDEQEADAVLLSAMHDIRWAVGFTGSNGVLIVKREAAHLVTDGRYDEQARREVTGADVHIASGPLAKHVADVGLLDEGVRVLLQSEHVTLAAFERMQQVLGHVTFEPTSVLLDAVVAAKSPAEVASVRAAQAITDAVFADLLDLIRPGVTERELAAEITYAHLQRGASAMAFDPIVATGPNSALPHARASDRAVEASDIVLIDMGAYYEGYASDMTRTVVVGAANEEQRRVYEAVLDAQQTAIAVARAGMSGGELDRAAREVLTAAGYGEYFSHSLGHGLGLQVHAWPRLSQQVDHRLPVGATVTIEPGVYRPGRFGVRIEDIIALHAGGCENLTATPKTLLEL